MRQPLPFGLYHPIGTDVDCQYTSSAVVQKQHPAALQFRTRGCATSQHWTGACSALPGDRKQELGERVKPLKLRKQPACWSQAAAGVGEVTEAGP